MPLPALEFPFDGGPNEVRPVLAFVKDGLNPGECPLGEPGLHILGPHFFASHAIISHIRY